MTEACHNETITQADGSTSLSEVTLTQSATGGSITASARESGLGEQPDGSLPVGGGAGGNVIPSGKGLAATPTAPIVSEMTGSFGAVSTTTIPCGCSADGPKETGANGYQAVGAPSTPAGPPCALASNASLASAAAQNATGVLVNGTCVPAGSSNTTGHPNGFLDLGSGCSARTALGGLLQMVVPSAAFLLVSVATIGV